MLLLAEEAVAVETDAEEVDADVAHPDDDEAGGGDARGLLGRPVLVDAAMEVNGVEKPHYQGPSLLRIPANEGGKAEKSG